MGTKNSGLDIGRFNEKLHVTARVAALLDTDEPPGGAKSSVQSGTVSGLLNGRALVNRAKMPVELIVNGQAVARKS